MSVESILREEIRSPDRMVRLFALEQVIQDGRGEALLGELQARVSVETDDECRVMLGHAIRSLQRQFSGGSSRVSFEDPLEFEETFSLADLAEKTRMLTLLSESQAKTLAGAAPRLLLKETSPFLQSFLIRRFGGFWPLPELALLSRRLDDPSRSVSLATFRALLMLAPKELEKHLPRLLGSADSRVKSLALQGLAKIDPEEALLHFETMLLSRQPALQMVALENAVHLSFDRFQEPLLKLFVIENNLEILKIAGDFFVINPDPRVPFKLLEITEHAGREKVQLIKEIMTECGKSIRDSGILTGDFSAFWAGLTGAVAEKARRKTIRELLARLEMEELAHSPELVGWLRPALKKDPLLKAALENVSPESCSALVWSRLQALLKGGEPLAPNISPKESSLISWESFLALPAADQFRVVAGLVGAEKKQAEILLKHLAEAGTTSPELLVTALRTAEEIGSASLVSQARIFLKRPEDALVAQSIAYLGRFDLETIMPGLGAFLNSGKTLVRDAVMKIFNQYDPVQSVRTIQLFLRMPNQRQTALQWMLRLDFSLVREVLTEFLPGTIPDPDFELGLSLFQINPDPGNLYPLFRLQKLVPEQRREAVLGVWRDTLATLRDLQIIPEDRCQALEKELEDRYAEEQRRLSRPPPAYSVKNLGMAPSDPVRESLWGDLSGLPPKLLLAGLLLCLIGGGIAWILPETGLGHPFMARKKAVSSENVKPVPNRLSEAEAEKNGEGAVFETPLFDAPGPEMQEFLKADRRRADLFDETSRALKEKSK